MRLALLPARAARWACFAHVVALSLGVHAQPEGACSALVGCRYSALSAQQNSEEAIDVVLIESYAGSGTMWNGKKQYKYIPFNPNDKYTVAFVEEESTGKKYRLLKGAPQV